MARAKSPSQNDVHGTFFTEPEKLWFETHNAASDVAQSHDFKQRLYPLNKDQYSPWEPTVQDMTPMSKAVGACYDAKFGKTASPAKAAIHPPKMGHIQGHTMPTSKGVPAKKDVAPLGKGMNVSDNPSWGKQVRSAWAREHLFFFFLVRARARVAVPPAADGLRPHLLAARGRRVALQDGPGVGLHGPSVRAPLRRRRGGPVDGIPHLAPARAEHRAALLGVAVRARHRAERPRAR